VPPPSAAWTEAAAAAGLGVHRGAPLRNWSAQEPPPSPPPPLRGVDKALSSGSAGAAAAAGSDEQLLEEPGAGPGLLGEPPFAAPTVAAPAPAPAAEAEAEAGAAAQAEAEAEAEEERPLLAAAVVAVSSPMGSPHEVVGEQGLGGIPPGPALRTPDGPDRARILRISGKVAPPYRQSSQRRATVPRGSSCSPAATAGWTLHRHPPPPACTPPPP